ncbi:hypothetical protein GIB67_036093 [Kingdonia uniflora]|uniref:ABC transporter domain-containing protein n=1 Tax=Kingdonia uniflora TaxID=39325 RepID=A0A7J7N962_9MAGN|nr:hypothetical protein GIB67_036093 [Kingdonia uniflora]
MDVKRGGTIHVDNSDGARTNVSSQDHLSIFIPSRKSCTNAPVGTRLQDHEELEFRSNLMRKTSLGLGKKMDSSSRKNIPIRKTKSLSAQFLVDIDELVKTTDGNINETSSIGSKHTRNGRQGFSFSLAETFAASNDISDVSRLTDPNCKDSAMGDSPLATEEDPDMYNFKKLQIEPTLPIFLKFQDVKYKVAVKGRNKSSDVEKFILHGVTGSVHPGEILALMGPSGGGKTTLLNLLSGRVKSIEPSGIITYNDQPYSKSLKRRIGFVLQDDVVFPHLTVKETLTYAALLRLPKVLSKQQKKDRAVDVISELGLERCQNTVIGGGFVRGISGGERKRVCIGNEILLNPSLLFLDEPTSGLDSTTALRIIQMLQNIAEAGKTVVTTIHQPSSRLFNKFDKLILLGKGSSLYFGKASEAMMYFTSIGCAPLIAMNPADFLIDLANGNIKDKSFPSQLKDNVFQATSPSSVDIHKYLIGAYETKVANIDNNMLLRPALTDEESDARCRSNSREWGATWWEQYSILFRRGLKERRHEYLSCIRITQVISTAIIIGLLWWHSDASSPKRFQDQAGLLFFISVFWGFFPIFTAIFTFPQERAMLVKERSVGMYKLSAYFVARNLSDLPLDLILPIVFLVIVYFMSGLKQSFSAFFLTLSAVFLSIIAAQGLGLAIGAAFMDVKKATTVASVIIMTFMLSGGFFLQNVPSFMSWVRYISFNYHTYSLLLKIQYSCSDEVHGLGSCKYSAGFRIDGGVDEACALLVMIFVYRLLAYVFLRRMKLSMVNM